MTSDKTLAELYDALSYARDYYRQETGERDIPDYGCEAGGFDAAEEIMRLDPEDRQSALENVSNGTIGGYLKAAAAAYRLAWLEENETLGKTDWLSMFSDMVSGPQVPEGFR
jgi:hypothetical protein